MKRLFRSATLYVLATLCVLLGLSNAYLNEPKLKVKGVLKHDFSEADSVRVTLIHDKMRDSTVVDLKGAKFRMDLDFEEHYLLMVEQEDEVLKKILISSYRPISTLDYQLKIVLDLKDQDVNRRYGIMEYNGFAEKFEIRPLLRTELKRRRYEFESFYTAMLQPRERGN